MLQTAEQVFFPSKTLFKAMTQQYEPYGRLRKTPDEVLKAKFTDKSLPLRDEHRQKIGTVDNFVYRNDSWEGDIIFNKKLMQQDDINQLLSGQKKDLSIGYHWTLKKDNNDIGSDGDQTDILVDHVAWTQKGRCSSEQGCGLDSLTEERKTGHDTAILMSDCDEKDIKIQELTAEISTLKEQKVGLDSRLESLSDYETKDMVSTIKEILHISNYTEDSLKTLSLEDLKDRLAIVKMGKGQDAENLPAFPPGSEETLDQRNARLQKAKKAKNLYNTGDSVDLTSLMPEDQTGGSS